MKIAVIGSGISGNLVARLLCARHEVHVLEAAEYIGGHSNTVKFEAFGSTWYADTGFMVFNDRTYPNFVKSLERLDVPAQDSDMSFSVNCDRTGLEYQGSSLDLSRLQRLGTPTPVLLTLNRTDAIDPRKVIRTLHYEHPAYSLESIGAQQRFSEINGVRRTFFCGAYWGYGFHEDGVNSALAVANYFDLTLESCTAASTKDESPTVGTSR